MCVSLEAYASLKMEPAMSVAILFESIEGQTRKIAEYVADRVGKAGLAVTLIDVGDKLIRVSFDGVDKVILAAPVHERRHPEAFEVFIGASRSDLQARRTLMLSVSLSAAFPEAIEEAGEYLIEMEMRTGFVADASALVAGAVKPGSYDWFARQVVRTNVLLDQGLDVTDADQEFTDWAALDATVKDFLDLAAS